MLNVLPLFTSAALLTSQAPQHARPAAAAMRRSAVPFGDPLHLHGDSSLLSGTTPAALPSVGRREMVGLAALIAASEPQAALAKGGELYGGVRVYDDF